MFESLTKRLAGAFQSLRGERRVTEANVAPGLEEVRRALLDADVHFRVARDLVERVKARVMGEEVLPGVDASQQFAHAVHATLVELMGPEDGELDLAGPRPTVVLMAGLQGAGKTTTCGKLALHLRDKKGRRPLLVAADVKRPAAVEQLRVLGERIGVPVFHEAGLAPEEVCARGVEEARARGADVVLLDTAGRLHVDDDLMDEVARIAERTRPRNQVLVVDAMTGQDAVRSAEAFHARLALTGVILTKLDGDARGGAAVSLKAVTGRPILFVGTGEKLEDLDPFGAERMAGRILGMGDVVGLVERAQEAIDEKEAQASFERMVMGAFTLEDMLSQIRMIQRLGPLKKVLGMMPGIGSMLDGMDVDDRHLKRLEALFLSMTPRERLQPQIIEMGRRRRIARGAGQDVSAVNQLLKMHKGMGQMMKKMGLGGRLGAKQKRQALEKLSADGALAADDLPRGGLLGGLGGLAGGLPDLSALGGFGGLGGGAGGFGAPERQRGSSPTRQSGKAARDKRKREKRDRKKGRRK